MSATSPIFYVIDKDNVAVEDFDSAAKVAGYMLGRVITKYIIIKCSWDEKGNLTEKIVNSPSRNIKYLELQLNLV